MEFKELIVAFGAKYGIEGLDGADGVAELDVGGTRVEVLEDTHANSLLIYAEIGNPPPDANGVFGAMMLQANFLFRGTNGATLCQNPETHTYAPLSGCFRLRLPASRRLPMTWSRSSTRQRTGERC